MWRNAPFNVFWSGQLLSSFGDALALLAVPLLVLQLTGSVARMGLVTAAGAIGSWGASLWVGRWVDAVDRRRLMVACDVGRALLYGLLALCTTRHIPGTEAILFGGSFLLGAFSSCFDITYIPLVARMVSQEQLTAANARIYLSAAVATLAAPLILAVLTARYGLLGPLTLNGLSFCCSAVSLTCVPARFGRNAVVAGAPRGLSMLDGLRALRSNSTLLAVVALCAAYRFMSTSGNDLLIFHVKNNLHLAEVSLGLVFMLAGVGYVTGALLASRVRRTLGFGLMFIVCLVGSGLVVAPMGFVSLRDVAFLSVGFGFFLVNINIGALTARQELVPSALQGRVAAAASLVMLTASSLGSVAMTSLAARVGVPVTFTIMGGGAVVLGLVGTVTALRTRPPSSTSSAPAPALGAGES